MISEIRLFLDNIKPALLLKTVDDDLKDFYIKEVDGGYWLLAIKQTVLAMLKINFY